MRINRSACFPSSRVARYCRIKRCKHRLWESDAPQTALPWSSWTFCSFQGTVLDPIILVVSKAPCKRFARIRSSP
jgi:hypothetical protein